MTRGGCCSGRHSGKSHKKGGCGKHDMKRHRDGSVSSDEGMDSSESSDSESESDSDDDGHALTKILKTIGKGQMDKGSVKGGKGGKSGKGKGRGKY